MPERPAELLPGLGPVGLLTGRGEFHLGATAAGRDVQQPVALQLTRRQAPAELGRGPLRAVPAQHSQRARRRHPLRRVQVGLAAVRTGRHATTELSWPRSFAYASRTSAAGAAPLVAPHRVEAVLLNQGAALRGTKTACCFQAALVVVQGEPMHGDNLDLAIRVVQQSIHGIGEDGITVPTLADGEASVPPYCRVHVLHQHQQRLTNLIREGSRSRPRADPARHRAPNPRIGMAGVGQKRRVSARIGVLSQRDQHLDAHREVRFLGRPVREDAKGRARARVLVAVIEKMCQPQYLGTEQPVGRVRMCA